MDLILLTMDQTLVLIQQTMEQTMVLIQLTMEQILLTTAIIQVLHTQVEQVDTQVKPRVDSMQVVELLYLLQELNLYQVL